MTSVAPVAVKDRIFTLDMLRGAAVLGILAVNAAFFAWPVELAMGGDLAAPWPETPDNRTAAWAVDVFFQDKFRSLFSLLFGASIFLIGGDGADEERGRLLTRRLMWLGLFGLIHGLVFWYGDILLHYAYCGLLVMMARAWPARRLLWIGGGISVTMSVIAGLGMLAMGFMKSSGMDGGGGNGNPFAVTPEQLSASIDAYRSGWPAGLVQNLKAWLMTQTSSLVLIPITAGLMLVGMGLFKSGFLVGRSPAWLYAVFILAGGANLAALAVLEWKDPDGGLTGLAAGFAPLITLAYASLLILLTRFGLRVVTARLASVGRMAFTNYLTQTLIMASLFYLPWGPTWFGDPAWGPGRLWLAIGAVWAVQLIWSPLWLSRFQMGPFEWAWRRLTYGRDLPLRRAAG